MGPFKDEWIARGFRPHYFIDLTVLAW